MRDGRWRISVTAPDWGQDHLSTDAIVAFVDGELAHGPHARATQHLAECHECAAQVVAQGQARSALRAAQCPSLPSSLLSSLRSIPQDADLPSPPRGLAVSAEGQVVSVLRPGPDDVTPASGRTDSVTRTPQGRPPVQRFLRVGTGVAVSGIALGALAFAGGAQPPTPPANPAGAERGVLGGSVLGGPYGADAQLRLAPTAIPAIWPAPVVNRIARLPETIPPR